MNTQTLSQPTFPSALMMSSRRSMLGLSPTKSPGVNGGVLSQLKARSSAYTSGYLEALRRSRYDLRRAIKDAKRAYRDKLVSNYRSSDPRHMWRGLRAINRPNSSDAQPAASLPDELNAFYAQLEVSNNIPTARLAEDQDNSTLSLPNHG